MRRSQVLAGVLLAAALGLTGCAASPGSHSLDGVQVLPHSDSVALGSATGGEMAPGAAMDAARSSAGSDQVFIVNGYVTITVEQPAEAASDAARIVERAGGRVDARTERAPRDDDKGSAQLTVRIPSEKLSETLDQLKELGTVEHIEQNKANVTSQVRDLDARITALRASVDRLLALMASASTTADLIDIESALSQRQADLESMESQKRGLDDQVALSTFDLYLGSVADAPAQEPDTFLSGLIAGWNAFVAFMAFVLVALGVLIPWLAFGAVIAVLVVVLVRRRRRRRTSTAAEQSAAE